MVKIYIVDWILVIFKNYMLWEVMFVNWCGFLFYGFFEFGNFVIDGIMGGEWDLVNVLFSLIEEFMAFYWMYFLLCDSL